MLSRHQASKFATNQVEDVLYPHISLDGVELPSFLRVDCRDGDAESTEMCIDVLYPDGSHDLLLMSRPYQEAPTVLKGTLKSDSTTKVVVILGDGPNSGSKVFFYEDPSIFKFYAD